MVFGKRLIFFELSRCLNPLGQICIEQAWTAGSARFGLAPSNRTRFLEVAVIKRITDLSTSMPVFENAF